MSGTEAAGRVPWERAAWLPGSIVSMLRLEVSDCGFGIDHAGRGGSQYVARPPLRSNTAPVVNEFSSETIHATIAAASSTARNRPRGIFESM